MFYAVAYAYGSTVVNNGNRPDRVYEFTRRELRDAWVSDGPADISASGYREAVSARHAMVRGNDWKEDGDGEGWEVLARQRVDRSTALGKIRGTIFYFEGKDHYAWVATASEREIVSWAKAVDADDADSE